MYTGLGFFLPPLCIQAFFFPFIPQNIQHFATWAPLREQSHVAVSRSRFWVREHIIDELPRSAIGPLSVSRLQGRMSIPARANVYARRHLCCVHVSALLTALAPVTQH